MNKIELVRQTYYSLSFGGTHCRSLFKINGKRYMADIGILIYTDPVLLQKTVMLYPESWDFLHRQYGLDEEELNCVKNQVGKRYISDIKQTVYRSKNIFGANLRVAREGYKLTRKDAAQKSGLSILDLLKIELGKTDEYAKMIALRHKKEWAALLMLYHLSPGQCEALGNTDFYFTFPMRGTFRYSISAPYRVAHASTVLLAVNVYGLAVTATPTLLLATRYPGIINLFPIWLPLIISPVIWCISGANSLIEKRLKKRMRKAE